MAFSGAGAGTLVDPYQITSWAQLAEVNNELTEDYKLMNDLSSSTTGYSTYASSTANGGLGWNPLGPSAVEIVTGDFDGNNKSISDMYISTNTTSYIGLFGYTGDDNYSSFNVHDLSVLDADVTDASGRISILIGNPSSTCAITNCYVTGELTSGINGRSGAIVAWGASTYITITNCSTNVAMTTQGPYVGGLVGYSSAIITKTNTAGTISCSGSSVTSIGGIVGYLYSSSNFSENYSSVDITNGNTDVGGIAGLCYATLSKCYSTGSVSGVSSIGGFIGNFPSGSVSNSYSTGSVSGTSSVGGFVGTKITSVATDSYWDTQTSGQATSVLGTGKTTAQMIDISTFTTWNIVAVATVNTRNITYIWNIVDDESYPFFSYQEVLVVPTNMKINIGDVFKDVESLQINIADVWKDVISIEQNIGDVWKTVF